MLRVQQALTDNPQRSSTINRRKPTCTLCGKEGHKANNRLFHPEGNPKLVQRVHRRKTPFISLLTMLVKLKTKIKIATSKMILMTKSMILIAVKMIFSVRARYLGRLMRRHTIQFSQVSMVLLANLCQSLKVHLKGYSVMILQIGKQMVI